VCITATPGVRREELLLGDGLFGVYNFWPFVSRRND
jgi:hypothetical protein